MSNTQSSTPELAIWADELLAMNAAPNHKKTLETLIATFLESHEADDFDTRTEVMLYARKQRELLEILSME